METSLPPRSLYGRLALSLLGVLLLVSIAGVALVLWTTRLHFQEVSQRLNLDLAAHLAHEDPTLLQGGRIDHAALEDTFHWLMVVNPSIELYLLDSDGAVLAYSAPEHRVVRSQVDLGPVATFVAREAALPILGDDPRDAARRKVFSAAPLGDPESPDGYLYVVLGSELYDSAARRVQGSTMLRLGLSALLVSLLLALGTGLFLFHRITRRLRELTTSMARYADGHLQPDRELRRLASSDDEIGQLADRFQRMAVRLDEQFTALEASDQERRELVANVSHDLRTPLAALRGYLETLLLKEDALEPAERRAYLETAERHCARLGKLVADLFELSKLEGLDRPLEREPCSIAELVQDVVQSFELAAREREVLLVAEQPPVLPFVLAEIGLLERVLSNLVDNALRHTPSGGEVRVQVAATSDQVAVRVRDTGRGIPEEELSRVFERFHRGTEALTGHAGSGLGLSIARRIVELHGGSIDATSPRGEGATFTVRLASLAG